MQRRPLRRQRSAGPLDHTLPQCSCSLRLCCGSAIAVRGCVWSATPLGTRVSRRGKWMHNPGSKLPGQKNSRGRCSEPVELTAWHAVSMPAQGASFLLRPILDRFDCCLLAAGIRGPRIGEMAERFVQYAAQAAEENAAFPLRADKSSSLKRHSPLRERIGSSSMQSGFPVPQRCLRPGHGRHRPLACRCRCRQ